MTTKVCAACQTEKTHSAFSKTQRNKGVLGRCNECIKRRNTVPTIVRERVSTQRKEERKKHEEEFEKNYERMRQEIDRKEKEKLDYRLEHPFPPPHPDEGKWRTWKAPNQKINIESGGFCFGLVNEAQHAAAEPLSSFEDMADMSYFENYECSFKTNTVAKNGTWNAYKVMKRCEHLGEYIGGWMICHEDKDPVMEIRRFVFDTFEEDFGGFSMSDETLGTHERHENLGLIILPRYTFGTVYQFSESKGQRVLDEGIYFVDFQQAQAKQPKKNWKNAIRGLYSCGDFDVARLSYDNGLCESFLLWSNGTTFVDAYFEEGTAPLGQEKWTQECYCPHHGCCNRQITVSKYLSKSGNKLCSNPRPHHEICMEKWGYDPREPESDGNEPSPKRKKSSANGK